MTNPIFTLYEVLNKRYKIQRTSYIGWKKAEEAVSKKLLVQYYVFSNMTKQQIALKLWQTTKTKRRKKMWSSLHVFVPSDFLSTPSIAYRDPWPLVTADYKKHGPSWEVPSEHLVRGSDIQDNRRRQNVRRPAAGDQYFSSRIFWSCQMSALLTYTKSRTMGSVTAHSMTKSKVKRSNSLSKSESLPTNNALKRLDLSLLPQRQKTLSSNYHHWSLHG